MANKEGVVVQSVARALDILSCFGGEDAELGISEIADRMQLLKNTTYGLVNTLVIKGYLEQSPQTRRYRLGIKLFQMGNLVKNRMDLHSDARPFCEALSKQCGCTVHLAAKYGDSVVYIDKVDTPDAVIVYSQVGKHAPMYCTGVGKAILAFSSEEEQREYAAKADYHPHTPHTIRTPEELLAGLREIRQTGYAVDNEEIELGLCCIAAPIFNHLQEPVAAISVSVPIARLGTKEDIWLLAPKIQHFARKISRKLGYLS